MRLEGLGQLKNPMTSSGIEPAAFRYKKSPRRNVPNIGFIIKIAMRTELRSGAPL
jgi:hypothetical protein